jgi:hypothetical protein
LPFTLSHAAALAAGPFAPGVTVYTANVPPDGMEFGAATHAFAGVVTVDVPIAWALVRLWLLVREPLLALLRCGVPRARVRVAAVG